MISGTMTQEPLAKEATQGFVALASTGEAPEAVAVLEEVLEVGARAFLLHPDPTASAASPPSLIPVPGSRWTRLRRSWSGPSRRFRRSSPRRCPRLRGGVTKLSSQSRRRSSSRQTGWRRGGAEGDAAFVVPRCRLPSLVLCPRPKRHPTLDPHHRLLLLCPRTSRHNPLQTRFSRNPARPSLSSFPARPQS